MYAKSPQRISLTKLVKKKSKTFHFCGLCYFSLWPNRLGFPRRKLRPANGSDSEALLDASRSSFEDQLLQFSIFSFSSLLFFSSALPWPIPPASTVAISLWYFHFSQLPVVQRSNAFFLSLSLEKRGEIWSILSIGYSTCSVEFSFQILYNSLSVETKRTA